MLFAQDGHQPAEKIIKGLKDGFLDGAIFCPRTHPTDKLKEIIKTYRGDFPDKKFLLDTNFYVGALPVEKIGKLGSHPFFRTPLSRTSFSSKNIQKYVKDTINYQVNLGLTEIVSPGVILPSFSSEWSQITLQLFIESIEYVKSKKIKNKLLLCLPIREVALREDEQLSEYLDELTTLEADGFYIIIERATQRAPQWSDPLTLAGLLYLVNALNKNEYNIIVGYSDIVGFVLRAVGATGIANGWWRNLRQFTGERFLKKTGGHQPKATYTSASLLNSIFIDPEMQAITEVGLSSEILSKTSFDAKLEKDPGDQSWSLEESVLHHWEVLKNLDNKINKLDNIEDRLNLIKQWIDQAQGLYVKIQSFGIKFDPITGPSHLKVWKEAITFFEQGNVL